MLRPVCPPTIRSLGPASAASQLLAQALSLSFDGYAAITLPAVTVSPTGIGFVGQGQPIPIRQLDTTAALTLTPQKMGVGFTLTREIIDMSSPNAETLTKAVASENIGAALDSALFSTQAGNLDQPVACCAA
jgi:hypothetical protein